MSIFQKSAANPVLGRPETGSFFDPYVAWDGEKFRMDFSYRAEKALAVTFSTDGVHWETPQITLRPNPRSGWEDRISRNCVLFVDGVYKMWYTGQARGYSFLGYAESRDGTHWVKRKANPIFVCDGSQPYEQNRVGGCCVVKSGDEYLLFYIGYKDIDTACVCVAKSADGIVGWTRSPHNPLVAPTADAWDGEACYKPAALWHEPAQKWMLWYNGRRGNCERIGLAECAQFDLF